MPNPPSALKRAHQTASLPSKGPQTTASGVVPGRALFDTPSPGNEPPELDRSQRVRKPSTRKLESQAAAATQQQTSKRRVRRRVVRPPASSDDESDDIDDADLGETSNAVSSQPLANAGPSAGDTGVAESGQSSEGAIAFFSKDKVVYDLKRLFGNVSHLSTQQLEKLINAIPDPSESETQTPALGNAEWGLATILQPATPLGLGGGYYRDRLESTAVPANSSQAALQPTPDGPVALPLNDARVEIDVDDSATESESDDDPLLPPINTSSLPRQHPASEPNLPPPLAPSQPPARSTVDANAAVSGSRDRQSPDHILAASSSQSNARNEAPVLEISLAANSDTATESETESESATESETESESESDDSDSGRRIEPSTRARTQPNPLALAPSKAPALPIRSAPVPSPRVHLSVPAPPNRNDPLPQAVGRAPRPSTSAPATSATPTTSNAQAGPTQDRGATQPQPQPRIWDRDIDFILDSIIKRAEERTRNDAGPVRNDAGPSITSSQSSAGPAGASSRPIAGLRTRPGRGQPVGPDQGERPAEDPAEVLEQAAAALLGKVRSRRKKPALSDFPGVRREIASAAIPEMQASAITDNPYARSTQFLDWASEAYENAWSRNLPNQPIELAPLDLRKVMSRRASNFRSKLKERLRPVVNYGYGFRSPVLTNKDSKHNRQLVKTLQSDTFHCRDLEPDTDQYEHPVFIRCIGEGLFWDPNSIGVAFHQRFNPVPLPAVALVLTMMQFCIQEWRSGQHEARDLSSKKEAEVYDAHFTGLEIYGDEAAIRLDTFQREWFTYGMNYAGVALPKRRRITQPITRTENVRPDTPPPANPDGSARSRRSKGKARASN